jgi:hypothetical protein
MAKAERMKIGYARVSTVEQNLSSQRDALKTAGCKKIVEDTASGGKATRDGLERVREQLRKGDVLVVCWWSGGSTGWGGRSRILYHGPRGGRAARSPAHGIAHVPGPDRMEHPG